MNLSLPDASNVFEIQPGQLGASGHWRFPGTTPASVITVMVSPLTPGAPVRGRQGWLQFGWSDGTPQGVALSSGHGQPIVFGRRYVFEGAPGWMLIDNRPYGPRYDRIRLGFEFWPVAFLAGYSLDIKEYW